MEIWQSCGLKVDYFVDNSEVRIGKNVKVKKKGKWCIRL